MSSDRKTENWRKELEAFLVAEEVAPPRGVADGVLTHVQRDLNPSLKHVSAKLFGLHALAGSLITLVCPQLGVGPVMGGHGIMHLFMGFGPVACSAVCGALFLGTSALFATLFLRREELRLARRYGFLNVTLLATLSFAGLMLAGGQADRLSYGFWISGAVFAGWAILGLGASIRLRPVPALISSRRR